MPPDFRFKGIPDGVHAVLDASLVSRVLMIENVQVVPSLHDQVVYLLSLHGLRRNAGFGGSAASGI